MSLKSSNKIETNKYELIVTASAELFEEGLNYAYKKNKNKINVQGFRKGKAPRKMIEKLYGEEVFFDDAVNYVYPIVLEEAITEAGLEIVTAPETEVTSISKADGVEFKAVCTVKPDIELGEYKGIKITKKVNTVTDEIIDEELNKMRDQSARLLTIEDGAIENGDIAVFDFDGYKDGVPFEGGKAEKFELEIGSGQFIPGFEDQMVGHKAGEEFDVNVKFPEEYHAAELAGADAVFKIKLHEIKRKELPEADDEFAKDKGFDTLDELKADITKKKEEEFQRETEQDIENKLIDAIVGIVGGEIPEVMYENELNEIVHDFAHRLSHQGIGLEQYLGYMGMDIEKFKEINKERAEKQVKLRLALEKISALENFEVTDEDVEEEYKKLATAYSVTVEEAKEHIPVDGIKKDICSGRAFELVKSEAKIRKAPTKKSTATKEE